MKICTVTIYATVPFSIYCLLDPILFSNEQVTMYLHLFVKHHMTRCKTVNTSWLVCITITFIAWTLVTTNLGYEITNLNTSMSLLKTIKTMFNQMHQQYIVILNNWWKYKSQLRKPAKVTSAIVYSAEVVHLLKKWLKYTIGEWFVSPRIFSDSSNHLC